MKPPPFAYQRADSAEDAVERLAALGGEAKVLAGGQSLVPMLAFRLVRPTALVDLTRLHELRYIELDEHDGLCVGALTTHRDLELLPQRLRDSGHALLADSARFIGHLPIRTRGTVGGSIAHADPAAELCVLATLADADVVVVGQGGRRTLTAGEFFQGFLTTALEPDELVVEVRFPPLGSAVAVEEYARRHGDFALGLVTVALDLGDDGTCRAARIALGAVDDVPVRASSAEAALIGQRLDREVVDAAAHEATRELAPAGDASASSAYRRRLATSLLRRALERAATTDSAAA